MAILQCIYTSMYLIIYIYAFSGCFYVSRT